MERVETKNASVVIKLEGCHAILTEVERETKVLQGHIGCYKFRQNKGFITAILCKGNLCQMDNFLVTHETNLPF